MFYAVLPRIFWCSTIWTKTECFFHLIQKYNAIVAYKDAQKTEHRDELDRQKQEHQTQISTVRFFLTIILFIIGRAQVRANQNADISVMPLSQLEDVAMK